MQETELVNTVSFQLFRNLFRKMTPSKKSEHGFNSQEIDWHKNAKYVFEVQRKGLRSEQAALKQPKFLSTSRRLPSIPKTNPAASYEL